jgi:DNA-directed RNA polymerase subunit RPC12/RpoP
MTYITDKTPMQFTVYIYADTMPKSTMRDFRCPRCSRIVFRTNSNNIFLTNKYGANVEDLPASSNYIEYRCHSCKALYNILFQ